MSGKINGNETELNVLLSPVLADKADVEFAPLQVFAGVAHDLVKGVLQKVVSADDEPEGTRTHKRAHNIKHTLSQVADRGCSTQLKPN